MNEPSSSPDSNNLHRIRQSQEYDDPHFPDEDYEVQWEDRHPRFTSAASKRPLPKPPVNRRRFED